MFGLCDCNNFFASCERVFNPSLDKRALVVLSNNDGCIIARSNEAKALGLKMGQPLYQAQDIIKKNDVMVFSGNYSLYGDMSNRVMKTLSECVPSIEIYSIDEAFINFDGFTVEVLQKQGQDIVRTVKRHTGIPVSLGIAPTRTLAKLASKLCKIYPKLQGCCLMYRPADITKVLCDYPIEDVWGIGRRFSKKLKSVGIHTAEQFCRMPSEWVHERMGITGLRTWKELNGQPCIEIGGMVPRKRTLTVSRSFAKEITNIEGLQEALSAFVAMAGEKLRQQKSAAGQMQVFILTNSYREDKPQHHESRMICFPMPTDSTIEMVKAAKSMLKELFRQGYGYKKAGITLHDISFNVGVQSIMFDEIDRAKHKVLMKTIDTINNLHGKSTVTLGTQTISSNREYLSPRYTTKWDEILVVKA